MASITRSSSICRPSCSLRYLRASQQTRSFASTRSNLAGAQQTVSTSSMIKNMPKQQGLGSRMKKMRRSEIPNDIGLIPQTYIRACGKMPSWFSEPVNRLTIEWLYLKQTFVDFGQQVYLFRWGVEKDPITQKKKKRPLQIRDRQLKARDLHKALYTALASGNKNEVKEITCSGLANEQMKRMERERINDTPPQSWSVKYRGWVPSPSIPFSIQALVPSYFKAIHTLADRQISLPIGTGMILRQAIVRIDSTQTLNRNDGSAPTIKKMREYFVMQKMMYDDVTEEWKAWGTIEPTSTKDALELVSENKANSTPIMDRLRAVIPGMS